MAERHPDLLPGEDLFKITRLVGLSTLTVQVTNEDGAVNARMDMPFEHIALLFDYGQSFAYVAAIYKDGNLYIRGKLTPDTIPFPEW
jgi:hypothetical protein